MTVVVVDYGMGNLRSVRRALEECGAAVAISGDPAELRRADALVIPGVGAFADGIRNLHSQGLASAIRSVALEERVPVLGICLGMQMFADCGFETEESRGLGLVPGQVRRMEPAPGERVPHVGWNEVQAESSADLLEGIAPGEDFYFVHSFHLVPADAGDVVARTPYAGAFVSVIHRGNIWGTQFHPEKSGRPGFRLLSNFLRLAASGSRC
jgi:imidazole glycerol-phosphate synthase subunit HisH